MYEEVIQISICSLEYARTNIGRCFQSPCRSYPLSELCRILAVSFHSPARTALSGQLKVAFDILQNSSRINGYLNHDYGLASPTDDMTDFGRRPAVVKRLVVDSV